MQLNARSINNLRNVDEKLKSLVSLAATRIDQDLPGYSFIVTSGLRTLEEQKELYKKGLTKTMNSKHLTGNAIDIAVQINEKITWNFAEYKKVADLFKQCARDLNVNIVWGGDWITFKDGPHFELK